MLLNCNCAKLAKFEDFYTCLGGGRFFVDTVYNHFALERTEELVNTQVQFKSTVPGSQTQINGALVYISACGVPQNVQRCFARFLDSV